jgi:squalene synthase HpnC
MPDSSTQFIPPQAAVADAYAFCLRMARDHYENFPVASRLLPAALQQPIAVVYAFARTADDFADEGDRTDDERLQLLGSYTEKLKAIEQGKTLREPLFIAAADIIRHYQLPISLFHDLITAFSMDVTTKRYQNFEQLLYYCRHSANPVGRLLLHITGHDDEANLAYSDDICSALQLINFLQDIQQDYHESGRIYIPLDDMRAAGVSEEDIAHARTTPAMGILLRQQADRAHALLHRGAPLGQRLPGRFGYEIRMTLLGGSRVIRAVIAQQSDLFSRPRLRKTDWLMMLWQALFPRRIVKQV